MSWELLGQCVSPYYMPSLRCQRVLLPFYSILHTRWSRRTHNLTPARRDIVHQCDDIGPTYADLFMNQFLTRCRNVLRNSSSKPQADLLNVTVKAMAVLVPAQGRGTGLHGSPGRADNTLRNQALDVVFLPQSQNLTHSPDMCEPRNSSTNRNSDGKRILEGVSIENRDVDLPGSISLDSLSEREQPVLGTSKDSRILSTHGDESLINENVSMIKRDKDPPKKESPDGLSERVTLIDETAAGALPLKIRVAAPRRESESEMSMSVAAAVVFAAVRPALGSSSLRQIRTSARTRIIPEAWSPARLNNDGRVIQRVLWPVNYPIVVRNIPWERLNFQPCPRKSAFAVGDGPGLTKPRFPTSWGWAAAANDWYERKRASNRNGGGGDRRRVGPPIPAFTLNLNFQLSIQPPSASLIALAYPSRSTGLTFVDTPSGRPFLSIQDLDLYFNRPSNRDTNHYGTLDRMCVMAQDL
ncbi:hypothetical protein EDD85DRAFT_996693 [Armillaria nabsnona]|nr:hypothetical protein EDD85DRAFT_996693 [Armillaria nabsnona]